MFQVLNMSLQIVRTVLKNEINEVSVCEDVQRENGGFYTVISITDGPTCRQLAQRVNSEPMFCENRDFIGSFTYRSSLNLVFRYRAEARLREKESILAMNFAERKALAAMFLAACAEAGAEGPVGELLLQDRNIHVTADGKVYFNYFLDFKEFQPSHPVKRFYSYAAEYTFELLTREYQRTCAGQLSRYPKELQAFNKKRLRDGFTSISQILLTVRQMPDQPEQQLFGWRRIWGSIKDAALWARQHSMAIFVAVLVSVTIVFAGYQITVRASYRSDKKAHTAYGGMERIGEMYLGNEDV